MSVSDSPPVLVSSPSRRPRWAIALALVVGLVAAFIAWAVGQQVAGRISYQIAMPGMPSAADLDRQHAAFAMAQSQTAAVVFAVLGGLLALGLGLLGGWVRASRKASVCGGVVGLILGAGVAAGLAMVLFPNFVRTFDPNTENPTVPFLIHGGYWGAVGLVAGLAFGLGRGGGIRHIVHAAVGGALGGVLGGVLFQVLGGLLFPLDKTIEPFAIQGINEVTGSWSRLAGRLLAALPIALGATGLHPSPSRPPLPTTPPAEPEAPKPAEPA